MTRRYRTTRPDICAWPGCTTELVPAGRRPERRHPLGPGQRYHAGRGLGGCHYDVARVDGTLHNYPRTRRSCHDVAAGWAELKALGYSRAQAAEELGMSMAALDGAITRAGHTAPNPRPPAALRPRAGRRYTRSDLADFDTRDEGEAS
jgi:hypothetical protein